MEKKFLHIVTPDDVETQVLSWGSFQWLNEPRVTGTENMAVGIGRIAQVRVGKAEHHIAMALDRLPKPLLRIHTVSRLLPCFIQGPFTLNTLACDRMFQTLLLFLDKDEDEAEART